VENSNLASTSQCLPVQMAVIKRNRYMVSALLDRGWDPDAFGLQKRGVKNREDLGTPLQIAVGKQMQGTKIIKLLLRYNCNMEATCEQNPHTPLQIASREGRKEAVELLYQYRVNVNAPPAREWGATALQFAAIQGYLGIATLLLDYEADVNIPAAEFDGRTALEGAAEHGRIDMVQLPLNAGATIVQEGEIQYQNAMRRASQNGHHAVRRLLEAARPVDWDDQVNEVAEPIVSNYAPGEQPTIDSTNQNNPDANPVDQWRFDPMEQAIGDQSFTDRPPPLDMEQGDWDWNGIYDL
jgi:hypothetical protein